MYSVEIIGVLVVTFLAMTGLKIIFGSVPEEDFHLDHDDEDDGYEGEYDYEYEHGHGHEHGDHTAPAY